MAYKHSSNNSIYSLIFIYIECETTRFDDCFTLSCYLFQLITIAVFTSIGIEEREREREDMRM